MFDLRDELEIGHRWNFFPKRVILQGEIVFWLRGQSVLGCVEIHCMLQNMEGLICLTRSSLASICAPLVSGAA
jgi:hypothetical protein